MPTSLSPALPFHLFSCVCISIHSFFSDRLHAPQQSSACSVPMQLLHSPKSQHRMSKSFLHAIVSLPVVLFVLLVSLTFFINFNSTKLHHALRHNVKLSTIFPSDQATVAYFLQLTNSSAHMVPRLLSSIYHPGNIYLLHFDTKVERETVEAVMADAYQRISGSTQYIYVLPAQQVSYAGISMVLNTLSGMSHLHQLDLHWDYFINLSGSDYPLVTQTQIRSLLGSVVHNEPMPNFFRPAPRDVSKKRFKGRSANFNLDDALTGLNTGSVQRTYKPNLAAQNLSFEPVYGAGWMMVSRDFVRHVLFSDMARKILIGMAYMTAADEHYFVSVAYNDAMLNSSIIPCMFRMVLRRFKDKRAMQHPFDLDEVNDAGGYEYAETIWRKEAFFARKFKKADSTLLQRIDAVAQQDDWAGRVSDAFVHKVKAGRDGAAHTW